MRLNLLALVLPLLVLSALFSSSTNSCFVLFNKVFSLLLIICMIVVFYRACGNKRLAISISLAVVLFRILRLVYGDESRLLESIYFVPYSILILGVGAKMLRDYSVLMLRQIVWICAICIALELMQIMGVQWAQSFTNFYWQTGGSSISYLFVKWSDLYEICGIQVRPVGFTSANNILSQYLLFFYGFSILWFTNKKEGFCPPLKWLFIISFACALSGAKLVIAGVIVVNIFAFILVKKRRQVLLIFLITCFAYYCYWLIFPGLFVYNYNIDLFVFNLMIRIKNLISILDIPYVDHILTFLSQIQTGEYVGVNRQFDLVADISEKTSVTGLGTVIVYWYAIVLVALLISPFWIIYLRKLGIGQFVNMKKLIIIMMVTVVCSSAGGPFLFTPYFWFFFSFGLYPLTVLLLRKPQCDCPNYNIPVAYV